MSAETLRRAAALMRERAEAASSLRPGPWVTAPDGAFLAVWSEPQARLVGEGESDSLTEHIASWHPAVALAVADWLEAIAPRFPRRLRDFEEHLLDREQAAALTVARAYLGSES